MNKANHTLEPSATPTPERRRVFSLRALFLALTVSVVGMVIANYHDGVILHLELTQNNVVAPLVLVQFLLFLGLINPILARIRPKWAFTGAELGFALALALVAASVSRPLATQWVRTIGYTRSLMDARSSSITPMIGANPFDVLPAEALLDSEASRVFDDGLAESPGDMVSLTAIPWQVWWRPFLYWAPLLLVFMIFCISFARVLYRQWAERELTSFPLASITADLIRRDEGRAFPDVFYKRSFWIGFGLIAVVFGINGLHLHFPRMIEIPVKFMFYSLANQFPFLKNSLEGYSLLRGVIYCAVVVVAVLLPAEISFTAWFSWPIMICCTYLYYVRTGQKFSSVDNTMMMTGSFWAMGLLILYAGRTYYLAILRGAFGFRGRSSKKRTEVDARSVTLCRCFLLSVAAFTAILTFYGVPLDLAVIWTLVLLLFFLVVCRLVAEMGIPWTPIGSVGPLQTMLGLLGAQAMGAKALALLTTVNHLTLNTTVYIPAVTLNAANLESRLSNGRTSGLRALIPFVTVMLAACMATAIWVGYSSEGAANDYPARDFGSVKSTAATIRGLYLHGDSPPEAAAVMAENLPFKQRWQAVRIDKRFPPLFAFGAALILLTGVARLRFPRFPLHPLPLVLLGTWVMSRYFFSFFIGWLIKATILKVGGGRLFERTRPFFAGVMGGLVSVYSIWVIVNILIFRNNNFTFEGEWSAVLRDMFSS